jgi:hypothetical protein
MNSESVTDFLGMIADTKRRDDCFAVLEVMKDATGVEPKMWGSSIVGFGSYLCKYANGREAEWPIIGFSPRKNDLTLYITPGFERFESLMARLGKFKMGKSCLYLKKLDDVDLNVLKELVAKSVEKMASKRIS